LKNEHFTRAGLLKHCLRGLVVKQQNLETDRSTYLDYIKTINTILNDLEMEDILRRLDALEKKNEEVTE
jgi:hypothetical protein